MTSDTDTNANATEQPRDRTGEQLCPELPEGWSETPDDLSESPFVAVLGRIDPVSFIDVMERDNGLYTVALNAGMYGNVTPDDYDYLIVSRGRIQHAVETLATRAPESLPQ